MENFSRSFWERYHNIHARILTSPNSVSALRPEHTWLQPERGISSPRLWLCKAVLRISCKTHAKTFPAIYTHTQCTQNWRLWSICAFKVSCKTRGQPLLRSFTHHYHPSWILRELYFIRRPSFLCMIDRPLSIKHTLSGWNLFQRSSNALIKA